jgi:hypothetical protein
LKFYGRRSVEASLGFEFWKAAMPLWRVAWAKFEMRNGKLACGRGLMAEGPSADVGFWNLDGGLAAEPLLRVACNWCRVDADGDIGVPELDGIISDV